VVPECARDAEAAARLKPLDWNGAMKSGFRVTGVLFLSFSAFAQQTVTIPVPGAMKPHLLVSSGHRPYRQDADVVFPHQRWAASAIQAAGFTVKVSQHSSQQQADAEARLAGSGHLKVACIVKILCVRITDDMEGI
jgi:predicted dienelactone hydrolase